MSDDIRPADAMYAETTPAPAARPTTPAARASAPPAAQQPMRAADAVYADGPVTKPVPQEPTRERQVVATAANAKPTSEIMYGDAPAAEPPSEEADAEPEVLQLLQVTDKLELTAPEGFASWNTEALDVLGKVVQAHGMEKAEAQGLLDAHVKALRKGVDAAQSGLLNELVEQHESRMREWRAACETDPDIVAYGVANARTHAKGVLRNVMTRGFRDLLEEYGLLDHPQVVKSLLNVRRVVTDRARRGY